MKPKKEKTIEICRSFSQKVSNPSNRFENMDFFASAKAKVGEKDKKKVSEELYAFVQDEVEKSVYAYKLENLPIPEQTKLGRKDFAIAKSEAPKSQAEQELADTLAEQKEKEDDKKVEENLQTFEV